MIWLFLLMNKDKTQILLHNKWSKLNKMQNKQIRIYNKQITIKKSQEKNIFVW